MNFKYNKNIFYLKYKKLKFKKESSPKVEFIFINYEQFNLWYDCLQYIIKINNQIPKIINTKAYIIHRSPNKKNE